MAKLTEAQIELYDDSKLQLSSVTGDDVVVRSDKKWSNAFSFYLSLFFGDVKNQVIGPVLAQRIAIISLAISYWVGNYCGSKAAMSARPSSFLGFKTPGH